MIHPSALPYHCQVEANSMVVAGAEEYYRRMFVRWVRLRVVCRLLLQAAAWLACRPAGWLASGYSGCPAALLPYKLHPSAPCPQVGARRDLVSGVSGVSGARGLLHWCGEPSHTRAARPMAFTTACCFGLCAVCTGARSTRGGPMLACKTGGVCWRCALARTPPVL